MRGWDYQGLFYRRAVGDRVFACRAALDIRRPGDTPHVCAAYDLLVMMLNPGSSVTKGEHESGLTTAPSNDCDSLRCPSAAIHGPLIDCHLSPSTLPWQECKEDDVQKQIIKLLVKLCLDSARIINLSDLRTPNSRHLSRQMQSAGTIDGQFWHSILSPMRREDLNARLHDLAMSTLDTQRSVCVPTTRGRPAYPARKRPCQWLDPISQKLRAVA
jgi:hypothetical protein